MVTSIPEKRDAEGNSKLELQPIIFQRPGLKIDTRLKVFSQDHHVRIHSTILKLQSAYFRKFLDSANKVAAANSSSFLYDCISVVDDGGEWGLDTVKLVINSSIIRNSAGDFLVIVILQLCKCDE